ncbi:MAG: hypothetical protein CVT81_02350 [Alphaproteobacteria bacterium HGW-Alphaproteobacteria-3]|nr:MAG: hypothetical protein CVT81_02350 [Alphaproteobacteria bacterium HGW-Alphaproteobacteria-3]
MLKSMYTAVAFAVALAFAAIAFNPSPAVAQDIAGAQADIEALLVQYAGDIDGLEAAIEEYVTNSEDPEGAAQAVIAVAAGLPADSDLKIALGRGLGAAIAVIALTNPTAATNMQALVAASGDETLVGAVSSGTTDKTASIEQNAGGGDDTLVGEDDQTPEEPASAT